MSRGFLPFLIAVLLAAGGLTACGDSPPVDEGTPAPAAFISPVDDKAYCGWVNNPHECDDSGYPPAPFAMPSNDVDRSTQGVAADFDLLDALLVYHITYHAFFNNAWYYHNYIEPAWQRHPGTYHAWRGHPVVRVTNVDYYVTNSRSFDNRYRDRERAAAANATYRTKSGKVYNGKTVPKQKFAGTNAKPSRAGNAPRAGATPTGTRSTGTFTTPAVPKASSGKDRNRPGSGQPPKAKPHGDRAPGAGVPRPAPPKPPAAPPAAPKPPRIK